MGSPSSTQLPRPFGSYELVRQLAVGGMAEVFVARAPGMRGFEKIVAIKMIHPRFSADAEFVRLLVEEANLTAQLSHRNIVQVIDLGQEQGTYYIAMEFIDGLDLSVLLQKLREQRIELPLRLALFIAGEVCDALDYAHRKTAPDGTPLKIVHRDVSPPNVLLSTAGEVKLADFGVAKAAQRATSTGAGVVKGKYGYMAPEQCQGQPVDARADIFALGCVLYEMLTGRPTYPDAALPVLIERVSKGRFEPPERIKSGLPAPVLALLSKSMAVNPAQRFATARAFGDEIKGFLYTLRPNPEGELSELITRLLESSRPSVPPMLGPNSFPEDEEESTQIESMAELRSKMAQLGMRTTQPPAEPPKQVRPVVDDEGPFKDEPTRALKKPTLPKVSTAPAEAAAAKPPKEVVPPAKHTTAPATMQMVEDDEDVTTAIDAKGLPPNVRDALRADFAANAKKEAPKANPPTIPSKAPPPKSTGGVARVSLPTSGTRASATPPPPPRERKSSLPPPVPPKEAKPSLPPPVSSRPKDSDDDNDTTTDRSPAYKPVPKPEPVPQTPPRPPFPTEVPPGNSQASGAAPPAFQDGQRVARAQTAPLPLVQVPGQAIVPMNNSSSGVFDPPPPSANPSVSTRAVASSAVSANDAARQRKTLLLAAVFAVAGLLFFVGVWVYTSK